MTWRKTTLLEIRCIGEDVVGHGDGGRSCRRLLLFWEAGNDVLATSSSLWCLQNNDCFFVGLRSSRFHPSIEEASQCLMFCWIKSGPAISVFSRCG